MKKENRINQYQKNYLASYGFEEQMVKYRRKLLLERLIAIKPKTVVEIGCGSELLYQHYFEQKGKIDQWIIVEPGNVFFDIAKKSELPNLIPILGFFEDCISEIKMNLKCKPDMIIMSSLLHEVVKPKDLLSAAKSIMGAKTILHINVPNITSFHRQLAKSMGLINDISLLSSRNIDLKQYRVYSIESLKIEAESMSLIPILQGGYFLKPFTHQQMQLIFSKLDESMLDGLYLMGKDYPNLASEIYIEVRKV